MPDVRDRAREETLEAMYRSVERMNHHIVEGNSEGAVSEQCLQINLRKGFESLSEGQSDQSE